MNPREKLNASAIILGLTSMIGQIVIIRELIVVFYGNELSLGIILASWLFWISIGSGLFGRLVDKLKGKEKLLSYAHLTTALLLPLNILFIRNLKYFFNIAPGKIIGFTSMITASFISLSFICAALGFTFTLISKIASNQAKSASIAVGRIYLLEGIGASIGGALYSFFLIKALSPVQNIFVICGINLLSSLLFNINGLQIIFLSIISLGSIFNWPNHIEKYTRSLQFSPFQVLESSDSIYGNITVTKTGKEFSFYENGLLMFTSGDSLTNEESAHYAMLEHPDPEEVLIIGGGIGGVLQEILKHPVKSVDYVELDPLIIKIAARYLPVIRDKRVNILHTDGRKFLKESSVKKYDVIIMGIPGPYNAMLNRFYSMEFFKTAKNILSSGGILSFTLASSENYINPEQAYYLASIYNTLKQEFQDVKILPGDTAIFLASDKTDLLTYNPDSLSQALNKRRIDTKFVREYYLPFKLDPMRIKYMEDGIKEAKSAKINKDFKPIGYFYHMALWATLFHSGKGLLPILENINIQTFIFIPIILFIGLLILKKTNRAHRNLPVILSIGTTGMSEISFQIIVILAFQFLYGYMYYKIGMILTSFMIGLVIGTFCINKILPNLKNPGSLYIKTQFSICLYPLILPLAFIAIENLNSARPSMGNSLQKISFAFLPIIAGFIGGFQFPLANKICLRSAKEVGKTTGLLYGIDLLGACIGGLIVSILLIPTIGIIITCVFLSLINSLILILLLYRPLTSG